MAFETWQPQFIHMFIEITSALLILSLGIVKKQNIVAQMLKGAYPSLILKFKMGQRGEILEISLFIYKFT